MKDIDIILELTDRIRELEVQKANSNLCLSLVMPPLHEIDFMELRKAKGLKQKEVSQMTGLSTVTLIAIEKRRGVHFTYENISMLWNLYNEA